MLNPFRDKRYTLPTILGLIVLILVPSCKEEEETIFTLLDADMRLFSQEQVNEFAAEKVTYLRGDLFIDGPSITDISGLSTLTGIEGTLTIRGTSLTQVDAFSNLNYLEGGLIIDFNEALENLDGFITLGDSSLVFETIQIGENPKLTAINQFGSLLEIEEGLFIWNNESLAELDFSGLIEVNVVSFSGNSQLSDLRGLSNLQKITEFRLTHTSLTSLNGLESLNEVDYIYLQENPLITSIDQFSELTEVPSAVDFYDNKSLAFVDFSNLRSTGFLRIHNSWLRDLSGFPALEHVQDVQLTDNDLLLALDELLDTSIDGWLWLSGSQITSLEIVEGFDLSGGFGIQESGITDLKGLEKVETMHDLWILDNPQLTSLDGLQNLSRVEDGLSIADNPLLESLEGLNALERVENSVRIYNCVNLTDFCALELLVADGVAVFAEIDQNGYNPTLQDIRRGDCKP